MCKPCALWGPRNESLTLHFLLLHCSLVLSHFICCLVSPLGCVPSVTHAWGNHLPRWACLECGNSGAFPLEHAYILMSLFVADSLRTHIGKEKVDEINEGNKGKMCPSTAIRGR